MFSQDINGSSCLSSEAFNCTLRGTSPVSLLDSKWWAYWGAACGGTLLHIMSKAMAKEGHGGQRLILMLGSSMWCWPYGMVHGNGGLADGFFVCGLVAWVQGSAGLLWWWYVVLGIRLVGVGRMHGLVWVGWWQLLDVLHIGMLCRLWC